MEKRKFLLPAFATYYSSICLLAALAVPPAAAV
jgi:hypothetical protein